jgi:eukaryotic-like serine/threonine-protein kinase
MPLTGGTRLGPYEILVPIGAGGMGEVYKARDTRLDRIVAVKVAGENFSERFEREARAAAALNHPHICTLHDVGPNYLVMEYIEGQPLQGPLPLAEALRLAVQIAEALDAAHKKGITHRDLKPANILVTEAGVKLLDFGLARFAPTAPAGGETVTLAMTTPGTILGTFQYMSPEQLEAKDADARSDIFAFGAVLYEMLTGRRAFEGKSQASLISAIMTSEPAPLAGLQPMTPATLERVIKKCLAKDPDGRWQSASDLADELRWIAAGGGEVPRPAEARSTRVPWAIGVIAAVVFAASLFLMFLYLRRAPVEQAATKLSVLPPANVAISSDSAPAISPDGRKLAFVAADDSGKTMLWVRPLDSLIAQPLAGTEDARQPFWSPDSRFLGFFSQSKLKKIETSGGPPQTVCDVGTVGSWGGTWGPDGVILLGGNGGNSIFPIEVVSAAGGQPKPATVLDRSRQQRGHSFPQFLPDGRHFLYLALSAKRENTGVYIGSLDSKDTKRLLSVESSALDLTTNSWSSDGRFIFFLSLSAKGNNEVWVLPLFGDRKPFPFLSVRGFQPKHGQNISRWAMGSVLLERGRKI